MQIFGLKTCDTCRKALKSFPKAEFIDVRAQGVPRDVLNVAHETFGLTLLNTRSTTWRGLDAAERAKDPISLLIAHPTLMKRPLIVDGDTMYLGWTKDVQDALAVL